MRSTPLYRRQTALLCFPFLAAGVLAGFFFAVPPGLLAAAAVLSLPVLIASLRKGPGRAAPGIAVFLLAVGFLRSDGYFRFRPESHIVHQAGWNRQVRCIARSQSVLRNGTYQIQAGALSVLDKGRMQPVHGGLLVRSASVQAAPILPGDTLDFLCRLSAPHPAGNPGDFDYRMYLLNRGIHLIAAPKSIEFRACRQFHGRRMVAQMQKAVGRLMDRSMPLDERNRSIARASLLGLQVELDPETENAFRDSGLLHVLAVSGFHTGLVAALAFFLFSLVSRSRAFVVSGSLILLWLYILLTGMPASAERAGWMSTAFLVSLYFERSHAPLNALAVSATAILLLHPGMLFDAGFQLSFVATAGILFWAQIRKSVLPANIPGAFAWLLDGLALSLSASLFTFPILLRDFGQAAALGFLASVPAGVLASASLVLDLAILAVCGIHPGLAHFYGHTNDAVIRLLCGLADLFSRPSWNRITIQGPAGYELFYYALLIGLFHIRRPWGKRLAVWTVSLAIAVAGLGRLRPDMFEATFLDVGNGDAILLHFPDGRNVMVDCGPCVFDSRTPNESRLPRILSRHRVHRLDAVVLSHYDSDHICGLFSILEQMPVGQVFAQAYSDGTGQEPELRKRIADSGVPLRDLRAGDELLGLPQGFGLHVLHPCRDFGNRNDNSLVLLLTAHGQRILLTGDVENPPAIAALASSVRGPVDLLKAPHHGEAGPAVLSWIKQLAPVSIVISNRIAGREQELMDLQGPRVLSTSQGGAIRVRLAEEGLEIIGPRVPKTRTHLLY